MISAELPKNSALYHTALSVRFSPEPMRSLAQTERVVTGVPSSKYRSVGSWPTFPTTIDLFMLKFLLRVLALAWLQKLQFTLPGELAVNVLCGQPKFLFVLTGGGLAEKMRERREHWTY